MKNQKGITLIALVITIIVLLILAGVAIAMLSGDNGILSRASESSVQNALGSAKDQCGMIALEKVTEYYDDVYVTANNTGGYDSAELDAKVEAAITTATVDVNGVTVDENATDKKIVLTYTDGSKVEGDLSAGKITWGNVVLAGE